MFAVSVCSVSGRRQEALVAQRPRSILPLGHDLQPPTPPALHADTFYSTQKSLPPPRGAKKTISSDNRIPSPISVVVSFKAPFRFIQIGACRNKLPNINAPPKFRTCVRKF
ncbi:unnamed protein product, partial [Iphiclides podalirius]